jgi:hypothetical protein
VVVGDEGGQQPGANVASNTEQENLHFGWLSDEVINIGLFVAVYLVN